MRIHTLTLNGFEDQCMVYCRLLPPKSADVRAEACKDFRIFTVSNDGKGSRSTNPELATFISAPPPPKKEHDSPAGSKEGGDLQEAKDALAAAQSKTAFLLTSMAQLESQIMGELKHTIINPHKLLLITSERERERGGEASNRSAPPTLPLSACPPETLTLRSAILLFTLMSCSKSLLTSPFI